MEDVEDNVEDGVGEDVEDTYDEYGENEEAKF